MRRRLMLMAVVLFAAVGLVMGGTPAQAAIGDTVSSGLVVSQTGEDSGALEITHTSSTTYTFHAWSYNRNGTFPTGISQVNWWYQDGSAGQRFVYSGSGAGAFAQDTWTVPATNASGSPLWISNIVVGDYAGNPNWTYYPIFPLP